MNNTILIKLSFVFALIFGLSTLNYGQQSKYNLAERYYQEYNYVDAAKVYDDILNKNKDDDMALRMSADCHERMGNLQKAEKQLSRLVSLDSVVVSNDLLNYADILKKRKKYDEAIEIYKEYFILKPEEEWVKGYFEEGNWASNILRDSSQFLVNNSSINTKWKEFAPGFIDDGLIYTSSRPEGSSKKVSSGESYLNVFKSGINSDGSLDGSSEMSAMNSKYHESNAIYDPVNNYLYFTRNNYYEGKKDKSSSGKLKLAIYYAPYVEGNIGKVRAFKYNDPEYSVGMTTISPDGQKLVFVSDMPGGFGGTDLYYCVREDEGWATPINFGPEINTAGNEMYPFIFSENTMYFASDGHPGLGGLDIFSMLTMDDQSKIKNMGYPVNTAYDDFGFILNDDEIKGYLSSDRPGGKGKDDIYEIEIRSPEFVTISGQVIDQESKEPIKNVNILMKNPGGSDLMNVYANTDENGNFSFEIKFDKDYKITGDKNGYFQNELKLESNSYSNYIEDVSIELSKYDFAAEGIVMDVETGLPIEAATVYLMDDSEMIIKTLSTGMDGKYFFGLYVGNQYVIKAEKDGYSNQKYEIDTRNRPSTVIFSDFGLFRLEEGTTVPLENILWDYNSSIVTASSKLELDRVIEILDEYPTMKIELSSHSDSRGTDSYNLSLSDKRANAAGKYLISNGIAKDRIVSKGYGETKLKNRCKNGVDCSDIEHQENRRTEFTILEL